MYNGFTLIDWSHLNQNMPKINSVAVYFENCKACNSITSRNSRNFSPLYLNDFFVVYIVSVHSKVEWWIFKCSMDVS